MYSKCAIYLLGQLPTLLQTDQYMLHLLLKKVLILRTDPFEAAESLLCGCAVFGALRRRIFPTLADVLRGSSSVQKDVQHVPQRASVHISAPCATQHFSRLGLELS